MFFVDYKPVFNSFDSKMPGTTPTLPELEAGKLYQYLFAADGIFVHSRREFLEAVVKVGDFVSPGPLRSREHTSGGVRGLAALEPFFKLDFPKIPYPILHKMWQLARGATGESGHYIEILFHLLPNVATRTWRLVIPEQEQSPTHVKPVGSSVGPGSSYERALAELHSHHTMAAYFSTTDDRDETGFRLYAVLGNIVERPTVSVRIGVFGYFLDIPASELFELEKPGQDSALRFECGLAVKKQQQQRHHARLSLPSQPEEGLSKRFEFVPFEILGGVD